MLLLWLSLLSIAAPIYGQIVIPKLKKEAFKPVVSDGEDVTSTGERPIWKDNEPSRPHNTTTFRPKPPVHYIVPIGGRAEIRCTINEINIQVRWSRTNNSPLPPNVYERRGVLYIDNVEPEAQGEYSCTAYDQYGIPVFSRDCYLTVLSPPRITLIPPRQKIQPGENAYINCSASGLQPIEISWSPIDREMPKSVYTKKGYIRFNNIQQQDAGKYLCRANNRAGLAEAVAHVIVEGSGNEEPACNKSVTVVSKRKSVCSGQVIFEDDFSGNSLNTSKWLLDQYIPMKPDYEFNIYVKDTSVTSVCDGELTIKPKIRQEDLKEEWLDLSEGCTRIPFRRAKCRNKLYLLHHPIASGRIVSYVNFVYGEVEIRAKLPSGDWIYPEIYLEDETNKKLIIAYARGNIVLRGNDSSNDFGGTLLFSGPIVKDSEPERSSYLSFYKTQQPLGYNFNTYKLKWTAERLDLYLNDNKYGTIGQEVLRSIGFSSDPLKVNLVLGVGVGGITDFPGGFKGNYDKPWINSEVKQMKKFYEARSKWEPSWYYGGKLIVDYVKITAI